MYYFIITKTEANNACDHDIKVFLNLQKFECVLKNSNLRKKKEHRCP